MDVLHLAEGLSPSAVGDHATYVRALERVTGAAAWSATGPSTLPQQQQKPPQPPRQQQQPQQPQQQRPVPAVPVGLPVREATAAPMGLPVQAAAAEGEWACSACTLRNAHAHARCEACAAPRPAAMSEDGFGLTAIGAMRVGAIKAELQARGVPTAPLIEKVELVEALVEARRRCA